MKDIVNSLQSRGMLNDNAKCELRRVWRTSGKTSSEEINKLFSYAEDKFPPKAPKLVYVSADEIKPERARWLWDGWIPLRALTILAGLEGLGKSMYSLHLAASLTRGELKGEYFKKPVIVSIYSTEDDRTTQIVPRLLALNADMKRIKFIKGIQKGDGPVEPISIERDIGLLKSGCVPRFVEKERRPPLRHQGIRSGGNLRVFENLAQTLVAVDAP